jgi:GNAT superfamily N-acetyltransferase
MEERMMFEEIRNQFFPFEPVHGVIVRPYIGNIYEVIGDLSNHIFTPFADLGAFPFPQDRAARVRPLREVFAKTHREQFVFYNEREEPVGWSYGEMRDAMTFFMSNSAVSQDYRRLGLYGAFLKHFLKYLHALGYERVVSAHQTNNNPVIIAKLKAGFVISGVILDERWSAQVELTYHLHDDRRHGYERAFSLEQRH